MAEEPQNRLDQNSEGKIETLTQSEPKKLKVGLIVAALLILLALILAGGYWYLYVYVPNQPTQIEKSKVTQTTLPETTNSTPTKESEPTTTKPTTPNLTSEQLENFTYRSSGSGVDVKVVNGTASYPSPPLGGGGTFEMMVMGPIVNGDINGDGVNDAIVPLYETLGGTGGFDNIAAVINKDGQPVFADSHGLHSASSPDSITIKDGLITILGKVRGPDQFMSDEPNTVETETYRLINGKLIEQ